MGLLKSIKEFFFRDQIKTGDTIMLRSSVTGEDSLHIAKIDGWGSGAPVRAGRHTIRRDLIRRNEKGTWFYKFQ